MLLLMIIGPLVAGAVVALIAFTPALGRRFRGELVSETPDVGEHHVLEDAAAPSRAVIEPRGRHAEPELDA